jgi:hypothetical protein
MSPHELHLEWKQNKKMNEHIAAEMILLEAEREIDRLRAQRDEARVEVERLKLELSCALAAEERAKKSRDEAWCRAKEAEAEVPTVKDRLTVRPEPSRLEIAAMAMQGMLASGDLIIDIPNTAKKYADALIAAVAKEGR